LDLSPRVDDLDPDIIEEVLIPHTASGIQLLPAPPRPEQADKVTGEQFSKVLLYLRSLYHYVIVDTSCYLTDVVLSTIDIADLIVLITTQEIPAVKNARTFLSLLDGMRISRQRIIFVMNRYNKQISITPEKIGESLRQEIVSVIPLDEKVVLNSVNRGVPFMLDNNKTQPVGRSIQALGDLIKERVAKHETPEQEKVGKK
jgi:pilus assembly protein CpaE